MKTNSAEIYPNLSVIILKAIDLSPQLNLNFQIKLKKSKYKVFLKVK